MAAKGKGQTMSTLAIAKVTTILTLTDGSTRIYESSLDLADLRNEPPIYCETADDAIKYLDETGSLDVNPNWYTGETDD